jgi:hypothetical protein
MSCSVLAVLLSCGCGIALAISPPPPASPCSEALAFRCPEHWECWVTVDFEQRMAMSHLSTSSTQQPVNISSSHGAFGVPVFGPVGAPALRRASLPRPAASCGAAAPPSRRLPRTTAHARQRVCIHTPSNTCWHCKPSTGKFGVAGCTDCSLCEPGQFATNQKVVESTHSPGHSTDARTGLAITTRKGRGWSTCTPASVCKLWNLVHAVLYTLRLLLAVVI